MTAFVESISNDLVVSLNLKEEVKMHGMVRRYQSRARVKRVDTSALE